ncbi:hypothetical protein IFM89_021422 [Coptis chinensis]|uniref:F-box domain-containing protein n=1 Tax=Coptis chinensis TaxID=261450 RepID=A0A835I432_9MAGN|nr:hypothetical protein IFM89_021422 [Coptis chinensis]
MTGEGNMISKDLISELPEEILYFTLSLLSLREAARTSILSSRWRYLWKTTSRSISLDLLAMKGSSHPNCGCGSALCENGKRRNRLLRTERSEFIGWVNQILQLDYSPTLDSFRLRFYMKRKFAHLIDKWISVAIAKRVQKIYINLSPLDREGNSSPDKGGCFSVSEIEIDARNLTRLEYWGGPVKFSFLNAPQLSNVAIRNMLFDYSSPLTYALRRLSSDLPKLESLILSVKPIQEIKIPCQLPLFVNLKKLVLIFVLPLSLWSLIPLFMASPYLQRLEVHELQPVGSVTAGLLVPGLIVIVPVPTLPDY